MTCHRITPDGLLVRTPVSANSILVAAGTAWITCSGDHRDHVLRAGQRLSFPPRQRIAVQALRGGAVCVEWEGLEPAA